MSCQLTERGSPRWSRAPVALAVGMLLLAACTSADHHLAYPREKPPQVITWSADFQRDFLLMHLEGARPPGKGPFPTVLVLPEEDQTAEDMKGVIWDLATRGYVAIAADYMRSIDGKFQRNTFAWRSTTDLTLILDATRAYPEVDQNRIGALGFSEGAVIGLLMAGHDPERIKVVVAYYPIVDFPKWYAGSRSGFPWVLFQLARWQLRVDAAAPNNEEFQKMLRLASPMIFAEYISCPVLLIHGSEDTLAYPEESESMAKALQDNGNKQVKLIVVPHAGRLFNFYQLQEAQLAWNASIEWLQTYLHPTPPKT